MVEETRQPGATTAAHPRFESGLRGRFSRYATRFLESRLWPWPMRWLLIGFLALLTWSALFGPRDPALNFATVMSWVLWWPLLALSYFLIGRVWCGVCPMGALSDITHRRLGLNLKAPRFFKNRVLVAAVLVFAIVYQAWIEEVTRASVSPLVTGFILWSFTAGAVVSGLLYERWTWCHNLCPLGAWTGVFSMSAMVEVRANADICVASECKGIYCYFGREQRSGCPFKQVVKTMQSNRFCSTCGDCLKACPNEAISVRLRPPTRELVTAGRAPGASALVSLVAIGVVAFQAFVMTRQWAGLRSRVVDVPLLADDAVLYGLFILFCIVAVLALFWLAGRVYARLNALRFDREVYRYGLAFLPLALMVHVAHNLVHLFNGYPLVLPASAALIGIEPVGIAVEASPNAPLWQYLESALVLSGLLVTVFAMRALARRALPARRWPLSAAPFLLLAVLFAGLFVAEFHLPMFGRVAAVEQT